MPVRVTYSRDYETKNLLFLTIGIDIPLIKPIVWDDRYRKAFHHSIFSDDRYRYVDHSPFYVSVLESKGARRQPVWVQSTLIRHSSSTPHASQRRIPEYGAVCPCCALSLG